MEDSEDYSVTETIENDAVLVTAHPSIWVDGHILFWPPGDVDRSKIVQPGPNWKRYMCRVLRSNIGNILFL